VRFKTQGFKFRGN